MGDVWHAFHLWSELTAEDHKLENKLGRVRDWKDSGLKTFWDANMWGKGQVKPCSGDAAHCHTPPTLEPVPQSPPTTGTLEARSI